MHYVKSLPTNRDVVFWATGEPDPFLTDPYLRAFMRLDPCDRRQVVRQVILLCATIDGLEPSDALEILAKISPFLNGHKF